MDICERIRENFNRGFFDRAMSIQELPEEYPAWTFKQNNWVGVAVPIREYTPFYQFLQVDKLRFKRYFLKEFTF